MSPCAPRTTILRSVIALAALASIGAAPTPTATPRPLQPLASWNESRSKSAIAQFAQLLPADGAPGTAPQSVRVAVFATEGVLWDTGVVSLETAWAIDRVRSLAPQRPEWASTPPFSTLLGADPNAVESLAQADLARLTAAAVAGLDSEEIRADVLAWVRSGHAARRSPEDLTRPAMRELLSFLQSWQFRNYVVSDGPAEVTRALIEALYGLPPYRGIAPHSNAEVKGEAGGPRLVLTGEPAPPPTGASRLRDVAQQIGIRPLIVAGNPEKDAPLFQWAYSGKRPFLGLLFRDAGSPAGAPFPRRRQDGPRGTWVSVVPLQHWKPAAEGPAPPAK
ncbi:MAG TPA: hypothetical protein VE129_17605 [Thermoanaerobaculia bacterium]|nr:hypothetical protein [Thermoanaerobaculia bacterium]